MTISKDLIDAGRGAVPCDLNLANCSLLDLLRGEIRKNATVSIRRGVVAGVDDGLRADRVLDLKGQYLAPGLIDSHVHIESSLLSPPEYARIVAPLGQSSPLVRLSYGFRPRCKQAPGHLASAGLFRERVMFGDERPQSLLEHMGVNLRRRDVGMAEQLLHDAEIGAVLEEVAREGMAKHMR